jgi:hypothetical protein
MEVYNAFLIINSIVLCLNLVVLFAVGKVMVIIFRQGMQAQREESEPYH